MPSAGGNDELGRLARTLNEMLARIDRSVTRERTFVSDASHELRSPLAVLRTELELVARKRPTGTALQSAVGSAIEETDRLSRLAEDLLMLSRADDGELTLRLLSLSAAELLNQAAGRARRAAPSATLGIVVQAPDGLGVLADRDLASRAIDNLLSNALRYARAQVQLVACVGDGFVELHVIDDGAGFPADFIGRAWDRFARADAGRTEGGAGVGLAIVARITQAHGG